MKSVKTKATSISLLFIVAFSLFSCQDDIVNEFESHTSGSTKSVEYLESEQYYFLYKDQKIKLSKSANETFITFKETDKEILLKKFQQDGIIFNEEAIRPVDNFGIQSIEENVNQGKKLWTKVLMTQEQAKEYEEIDYFSPYFKNNNQSFPLTHHLYVSLRNPGDIDILKKTAEATGTLIDGAAEGIPNLYVLSCTKESSGNALELANSFNQSGMFEYAQPAFIDIFPSTNDTYYSQQWNLHNTGQSDGVSGIDIKYSQAYSMIPSTSNITVGVIDSGIDLTHNDLNLSSVSWDAVTNRSNSQNHDETFFINNDTSLTLDQQRIVYTRNHGTNVAGIICAKKNNSRGIAGVSSPTKVVPISIKYSDTNSILYLARAIRKATDLGVSVINLSIEKELYDYTIASAISYAIESGRNGKGCIIVCSSGNGHQEHMSFPASTTPGNQVVAVGAIDEYGVKTFNAVDSTGSNYGPGLDLVAPGRFIPTTQRGGGYDLYFSGTSAAAPHVSAVAALILSKNPDLTYNEVEYILCRTANKSLPHYSGMFSNGGFKGTWYKAIGHGLLNMQSALTMAQSTTGSGNMSISGGGPANMEGTGYAWSYLTASPNNFNYTYFWSGEFLGQCDRWYIWPTNEYGSSADVSVYLNPGQTGGTLVVTCKAFSGNTYIGKATTYVYVTPNSNEY